MINIRILNRIMRDDDGFYDATLPFCQIHLDYFVKDERNERGRLIGYKYNRDENDSIPIPRPEFNNLAYTNYAYNVMKLRNHIESMRDYDYAADMIKDDIVTDRDVIFLRKVSELEGIDIPGIPRANEL